ncbi:putative subunit of Golgi mannosyltransferase complex [Trichoderma evansii]
MFVGGVRSSKLSALLAGTIIFIIVFAGLAWNQMDYELPTRPQSNQGSAPSEPLKPDQPSPPTEPVKPVKPETSFRDVWFEVHKPSIKPDAKFYQPFGAFKFEQVHETHFPEPMGEDLCIIDLDNRPFDVAGQVFGPTVMSWDTDAEKVHGLSVGVLNHWLYAKIHGYKYYFVAIEKPEDRRASWKKAPVISTILKKHKTCLYLDSDAIFQNLDLPFEWLLNYWDISPTNNSLALAVDPDREYNKDKFGKLMLNTGFIITQNNAKTYEIMDAWAGCPEENGKHPECVEFRTNSPGRPTDQGGFGTFIRYDYPDDIKQLACTDANGFPNSDSECEGRFIRHLWTGKDSWIKIFVGQQVPGAYLEMFHKEFLEAKPEFYITEKDLMAKAAAEANAAAEAKAAAEAPRAPSEEQP